MTFFASPSRVIVRGKRTIGRNASSGPWSARHLLAEYGITRYRDAFAGRVRARMTAS